MLAMLAFSDRYPEALKSLRTLRFSNLQACRDLYYIHKQLAAEALVLGGASYLSRAKELFTNPRVRRATLASFVVMLAQQVSRQYNQESLNIVRDPTDHFLLLFTDVWYQHHRFLLVHYLRRGRFHQQTGSLRLTRLRRDQLCLRHSGLLYY